ncbi:hypothetical protein P9112_004634 [Eukaryota sp. TZLM1-RC]
MFSKLHEEHLRCAICLDFATDAVESDCCHALFCNPCFEQLHNQQSCPACRSSTIKVYAVFNVRRLINELPAICSYCNLTVTKGNLKNHQMKCSTELLSCTICNHQSVKRAMVQHLAEHHPDTLISTFAKNNTRDQTSKNTVDSINKQVTSSRVHPSMNREPEDFPQYSSVPVDPHVPSGNPFTGLSPSRETSTSINPFTGLSPSRDTSTSINPFTGLSPSRDTSTSINPFTGLSPSRDTSTSINPFTEKRNPFRTGDSTNPFCN